VSDEKVVSLHKPGHEIKPPDGWRAASPFGHLKKEGERLARVGDVLRWLEDAHEWSREQALSDLLARLPNDAVRWVCWVNVGKEPIPVTDPDSALFGFHTAAQRAAAIREYNERAREAELRRYYSIHPRGSEFSSPCFTNIRPYWGPRESEPGLPALKLLLSCWSSPTAWIARDRANVDTVDILDWPANHIAVPLAKAAEWWGYGRIASEPVKPNEGAVATLEPKAEVRTAWADVLAQRLAVKGMKGNAARWTDPQCMALHDELTRLEALRNAGQGGKLTPLQQVAQDLTMKGYQSLDAPRTRGKKLAAKRQADAAQVGSRKSRRCAVCLVTDSPCGRPVCIHAEPLKISHLEDLSNTGRRQDRG
jgi:hypothetical protein